MNMPTHLAQATETPENGASRAEDFQPQTQNPQAPANTQQQNGQLQDTTTQDVLSNPNARINVPINPAPPPPTPQVAAAQVNWLLIILVTVALAIIAQIFVRSRRGRTVASQVYVEEDVMPVEVEESLEPAPKKVSTPKVASKKKTAHKKKSKSKSKKK